MANGTFTESVFVPGAVTLPKQIFESGVRWDWWGLPLHGVTNFLIPLLAYIINCTLFDEKMPPDSSTKNTSLKQHLRHAIECSISIWTWQMLMLNDEREEPDLSTFQCIRNFAIHIVLSDALFFWSHYACHQKWTYELVHKQHHTHKATPNAETKMNALSGTCVSFLDMAIIGHMPVFLPCFFVSLPFWWMIGLIAFMQFHISLLHCVGSRTDMIPNLGGLIVHCHDHHAHHKYGRENVNYGIIFTFWDRVMGTHQKQDPANFFYIGNHSSRQPQQPILKLAKKAKD